MFNFASVGLIFAMERHKRRQQLIFLTPPELFSESAYYDLVLCHDTAMLNHYGVGCGLPHAIKSESANSQSSNNVNATNRQTCWTFSCGHAYVSDEQVNHKRLFHRPHKYPKTDSDASQKPSHDDYHSLFHGRVHV